MSVLQDHLLNSVRWRLEQQKLPINIRLWNGEALVSDDAATVTVSLRSPKALAALSTPRLGELARCYVERIAVYPLCGGEQETDIG